MDNPSLKGGQIWLAGMAIHEMSDYQASRAGIQLVPEDRRIIPGLTVEENLEMGAFLRRDVDTFDLDAEGGGRFRVVLHAEGARFDVLDAFAGAVVEVQVRELALALERVDVLLPALRVSQQTIGQHH